MTQSSDKSTKEPAASGDKSKSLPPKQIVSACIAGDRDAMQQIYQRCSDRVYALMVRISAGKMRMT